MRFAVRLLAGGRAAGTMARNRAEVRCIESSYPVGRQDAERSLLGPHRSPEALRRHPLLLRQRRAEAEAQAIVSDGSRDAHARQTGHCGHPSDRHPARMGRRQSEHHHPSQASPQANWSPVLRSLACASTTWAGGDGRGWRGRLSMANSGISTLAIEGRILAPYARGGTASTQGCPDRTRQGERPWDAAFRRTRSIGAGGERCTSAALAGPSSLPPARGRQSVRHPCAEARPHAGGWRGRCRPARASRRPGASRP